MISTGKPDFITFTLPPDRTAQLALRASHSGLSTADLAAKVLKEFLDRSDSDSKAPHTGASRLTEESGVLA